MRAQPRSRASAAKVRLGCARYFGSRLPARQKRRQKAVGATAFSEPTGPPARLTGPGCRLRGPTGPLTSVLLRALRFEGAIDELDDVHLGDAPKRIEPLGLFRSCDFQRQQFVRFVHRMAHLMPLLVGIGVDPRPAGIADIFFSLADLFEIFREFAVTLKQVDLKA